MSGGHLAGAREAGPAPFDRWLKQHLHREHDDLLQQDMPEELLRLICDQHPRWAEAERG